jgi:hypothetical protein
MVLYYNPNNFLKYLQDKRSCYSSQLSRRQNPETFRHICAVISPTGAVIGIGNNHCVGGSGIATKHAEHHAMDGAIRHVIKHKGRGHLLKAPLKVDVVVLRDTGSNSRPCYHCITDHIAGNPYFNVRHVYYSHETEGLIRESANGLLDNRDQHVSRFYAPLEEEDEAGSDEEGKEGLCTMVR